MKLNSYLFILRLVLFTNCFSAAIEKDERVQESIQNSDNVLPIFTESTGMTFEFYLPPAVTEYTIEEFEKKLLNEYSQLERDLNELEILKTEITKSFGHRNAYEMALRAYQEKMLKLDKEMRNRRKLLRQQAKVK